MGGFLLFLFILAIVVVGNLVKKSNASASSRRQRVRTQATWNFQQARRGLESLRGRQGSGSSERGAWRTPNIPAAIPADPSAGASTPAAGPPAYPTPQPTPPQVAQPTRTAASREQTTAQAWEAAWSPVEATGEGPIDATAAADLREDPGTRAFLPEPEAFAAAPPAAARVLPDPTTERYVGSAALESTLDSTIESSLLGMPDSPTLTYVASGGRRMDLSNDVAAQVVALLTDGYEVAAVRLICDSTDCGILDAMRTVESYR